jgi:hypothetical protein
LGAILAPILSGALLDRGWTPAHLYGLFAIPYVLAALAMLGIGARERDGNNTTVATARNASSGTANHGV